MQNNWSHCLQEFFFPGTSAEKSYHQDFKNFIEGNTGAGKTILWQKFEESLSSAEMFKIRVKHEPII